MRNNEENKPYLPEKPKPTQSMGGYSGENFESKYKYAKKVSGCVSCQKKRKNLGNK